MTNLLIKLFIKNSADTNDPKSRKSYGTLSSAVGITTNIILALIKAFAGLLSGSVAIIADAFNNLSDAGTSVMTMVSFKISSKPADKDHPFGHARMEYITSMILSFIIMLVGFELMKSSAGILFGTEESSINEISSVALILLGISIVLKLWLGLFYRKISKIIDSEVIKAAATDSLSDTVSTAAVLVSSVVVKLTNFTIIDAIVGVCVALMIIVAGLKILLETKDILLGEAPVKETVEKLKAVISEYPEIIGIHDLMVHNYGPGRYFASFHAEVNGKDEIYYLHDVIDNVERRIRDELMIECTIHMDPIAADDNECTRLKAIVEEVLSEVGLNYPIHDFRTVVGNTHTNLIFDIVVPFDLKKTEAEIKEIISAEMINRYPNHFCVITIDRG